MDDVTSPAAINAQSADETDRMDHSVLTEANPDPGHHSGSTGGKEGLAERRQRAAPDHRNDRIFLS